MQIIAILIGLVLLAAIAFYVSRPLIGARRGAADTTVLTTLEVQRDAVYAQIRELDMDHATGKTNTDDYQRIRAELVAQAANILKQIDTLGSQPFVEETPVMRAPITSPEAQTSADADVEAIIAARRKARSAPAAAKPAAPKSVADDVEAAIAQRRKVPAAPRSQGTSQPAVDQDVEALIAARRKSAPAAQATHSEGNGAEPAAAGYCHKCGKPCTADDVFCSKCGAALKKPTVA